MITIAGESAGGNSVSLLLVTPLITEGTFKRAIIESGQFFPQQQVSMNWAQQVSSYVLGQVKCSSYSCMRGASVSSILSAQASSEKATYSFQPLLANVYWPVFDGYVFNNTLSTYLTSGNFDKNVSILIGSCANEAGIFLCPVVKSSLDTDAAIFTVTEQFGKRAYKTIETLYSISNYASPVNYVGAIQSNEGFQCPTRRGVKAYTTNNITVYYYTFGHVGTTNINIPNTTPACAGAAHSFELPYLFPTVQTSLFAGNFTSQESQLEISMSSYWINFIATGNPNGAGLPTWNPYSLSSDNDLLLRTQSEGGIISRSGYYATVCNYWDTYSGANVFGFNLLLFVIVMLIHYM